MPITYQIDADKKTIRTKGVGPVTLPEVVEHFQNLEQDPECPEHADVLLDLSEVNSVPETRQLSSVIHEMKRIRGKRRFEACAIVASRDALFGMMRMFEAQAEALFRETRAFRIVAEAQAWLDSQQNLTERKPSPLNS